MERNKRPKNLAPEALACWLDSFSVHHPVSKVDIALGKASERVRKCDPFGHKGLAVIEEIKPRSSN